MSPGNLGSLGFRFHTSPIIKIVAAVKEKIFIALSICGGRIRKNSNFLSKSLIDTLRRRSPLGVQIKASPGMVGAALNIESDP